MQTHPTLLNIRAPLEIGQLLPYPGGCTMSTLSANKPNAPNMFSPAEIWSAFPLPLGGLLVKHTEPADKPYNPNNDSPAEHWAVFPLPIGVYLVSHNTCRQALHF